MNQQQTSFIRNLPMNFVTLAAGVVLLLAISVEILTGDHRHFSEAYLWVQFVVCLVFLIDLLVRMGRSDRRGRFFVRNLLFLLISIPYLNLIDWFSLEVPRDWAMLIGLMPMLRAFWRCTSSSRGLPKTVSINCCPPISFRCWSLPIWHRWSSMIMKYWSTLI